MNQQIALTETDITTVDGDKIHMAYEEIADILEIVFQGVKPNCAIELTEQIVLSFNKTDVKAAGLTILDFSILSAGTELGPRSFALSGLDNLPDELYETVTQIITQTPVSRFLKVLSYHESPGKTIPLTYLSDPQPLAMAA